jgi:hypothetical protein
MPGEARSAPSGDGMRDRGGTEALSTRRRVSSRGVTQEGHLLVREAVDAPSHVLVHHDPTPSLFPLSMRRVTQSRPHESPDRPLAPSPWR